jgi:hypothetical protein
MPDLLDPLVFTRFALWLATEVGLTCVVVAIVGVPVYGAAVMIRAMVREMRGEG